MIAFPFAIFTGAFLLFQVQPIIARFILPWFGGSPAVWTTCMLFFQLGLLGGYSYAHFLAKRIQPAKQPLVHIALLFASLFMLPVTPDQSVATGGGHVPIVQVLTLLLTSVGIPFVVLSASAPLLQHWFVHAKPGRSPFRLYALSNAGSLVALVSYPFVVEPALSLTTQTTVWSIAYALLVGMTLICAWPVITLPVHGARAGDSPSGRSHAQQIQSGNEGDSNEVTWADRTTWALLAACGSILLLATTNQMSQDVAVIPFLWVLPLSLYLVSFIICFARDSWYVRPPWVTYFVLSTAVLVYLLRQDYASWDMSLAWQIAIYTSAMFSGCMVCHGEMVRRRPSAEHLTTFYLFVSLGGALGGIAVGVVAPVVFDGYWELHLCLIAIAFMIGWHILRDRRALNNRTARLAFGAAWFAGLATLVIFLYGHAEYQKNQSIFNTRGFFGVLHVYEMNKGHEDHFRALYHGRINHGEQWYAGIYRVIPTAYYGIDSGVGLALERHPERFAANKGTKGLKVGVIGLGVGTLAAYGRHDDHFRFYEINDQTEEIARTYFSFLSDCRADVEVIFGDGRISLANELDTMGSQEFDVLVIDAFSGDAIPVHLLTLEAMELYARHLKPNGIIAVHVTNIHIDLFDVVRQLAQHINKPAIHVKDMGKREFEKSNDWVLITSNQQFLQDKKVQQQISPWNAEAEPMVWTDDFSNLFEAVDW